MADFSMANLIVSVVPDRNQINVPTDQVIQVGFLRDIDTSTFSDATISLQVVGTVLRVPVTYSYDARFLSITPTGGLQPNTTYQLILVGDVDPVDDVLTNHVSGIRDIAGNGFVDTFTTIFKTSNLGVPGMPYLISPPQENAIQQQPTFSWTAVANATYYEVQTSIFNTFETIFWPLNTDTYNQSTTTVTPNRSFTYNQEYWWRVRAVTVDPTSHVATYGPWSPKSNFYYGDPTLGTVTPDDAPLGVIAPTQLAQTVIFTNPSPGQSNVQVFPEKLVITVSGSINIGSFNENTLTVVGVAVDGAWTPGAFTPVFVPALNGSQFGGGGIIIPGPADTYQQIIPSGRLENTLPEASFDGTNTTITLDVPSNYWQNNNWYKIKLDIPELASPVEWSFTSQWGPVFESPHGVRQVTDFFIPELTDDDLWYTIRRNSLYAIFIQVYMPTKVDANWQIYQPPISFNLDNPPFYAREYVRIKSALDFLKTKYLQLLARQDVVLGDFQVRQNTAALKENLTEAIAEMKMDLKEWEDALRGHSNRGYARGAAAQRGSGPGGQIDDFDFIYRPHKKRYGSRNSMF